MIEDTKNSAKMLRNKLSDIVWQVSGAKERNCDISTLVNMYNDMLERYVQCRINMALIGGEVTLNS